MIRRFANIITEKGCSGMYSLHRLDVCNRLFYPSTAAADAVANKKTANKALGTLPRLPAPIHRFQPLPIASPCSSTKLVLFAQLMPRSSEDKIIYSDAGGRTLVYDAGSDCEVTMPCFHGGKGFKPTTIYVARPGEPHVDLYVLSPEVSTFDALKLNPCHPSFDLADAKHWQGHPLPPPPFTAKVVSHAVAGGDGNTICVSAGCGSGTYYFDTVKSEWRKAAGDWVLPFAGGAEYLPDLKLCLGFASDSQNLCAWDLSVLDQPPTLLHCGPDPKTWEDWATSLSLLNLGSGRFCAAKIFRVGNTSGEDDFSADQQGTTEQDKFAVFTGMEVVTSTCNGENIIERIVQHKSLLYMFNGDRIRWVL